MCVQRPANNKAAETYIAFYMYMGVCEESLRHAHQREEQGEVVQAPLYLQNVPRQ